MAEQWPECRRCEHWTPNCDKGGCEPLHEVVDDDDSCGQFEEVAWPCPGLAVEPGVASGCRGGRDCPTCFGDRLRAEGARKMWDDALATTQPPAVCTETSAEQWPECVKRWRGYASNAPRSWSGQVVRRHVVGRESQLRKMVDTARDCLEWLATAQPPAVCASAEVVEAVRAWQAIGLSDDRSLLGDMEDAQDFMLPLLLEATLRTEAEVKAEERERCAADLDGLTKRCGPVSIIRATYMAAAMFLRRQWTEHRCSEAAIRALPAREEEEEEE